MRLGIFGGTFDPIHVGHLVAGVNARYSLELDRVLFVVANEPWQKVGDRTVSPAAQRLDLVAAALDRIEGLEASSIEIDHGGPSYTADTVASLAVRKPAAELFLIVGADVIDGLETWERLDQVRDAVTLVVVNRPGAPQVAPSGDPRLARWRVRAIEIPAIEISSTDLRERAADGRPLDFLIPNAAIRLIREQRLYAVKR